MNTPRPVPIISNDVTFSRKKKSILDDSLYAPRSPVKSAPPVSRIFRHRRGSTPGAHSISFRKCQVQGEVSMISPLYKSYDQLYFDQCFTKLSKLGVGSFGEVWKVQSKEDSKLYAIKKSRDRFRGDFDRKQRLEEVNKSERLQGNPNCVHFYKAWEELDHLYIQYELCEMSLKDYAEKVQIVEEKEIWKMILHLSNGLKHLHDAQFAHMDIKPANLFLGRDGNYKIGDFGLVVELTRDLSDAMDGDSKYIAPELLEGHLTKAADIFSLGITILELACSLELPKGGPLWQQLRKNQLPEEFTTGLSDDLILLISSMMEPDPSKRPTVDQILNMHCVRQACNVNAPTAVSVVSVIFKPIASFWLFIVWLVSSVTHLFERHGLKSSYSNQSQRCVFREIDKSRSSSPIGSEGNQDVLFDAGCTPFAHTKGHESLTNISDTSVYLSPSKRSVKKVMSPVISPLFNRQSTLFRPSFCEQTSSPSSYEGSPANKSTFESPMSDCSPQVGAVSDKIVRSRLFTCSSDEDDDTDLQRVPKNLISRFQDTF